MLAVIYLRVGNKDQLDGSLSNQKNMTVANGYKGTSIDRPAPQEIIKDINDGFNSNCFIGGLKC